MDELLSEVQILKKIPHENIVRLYGISLEWHDSSFDDDYSQESTSKAHTEATADDASESSAAAAPSLRDLKFVHIVMELCSFSLDSLIRMTSPKLSRLHSDNRQSSTPRAPLDAKQRAQILQQVELFFSLSSHATMFHLFNRRLLVVDCLSRGLHALEKHQPPRPKAGQHLAEGLK